MREPRKYLRHRLLKEFGLQTQTDFDNMIRRYSIDDIPRMLADIQTFLETQESNKYDVSYVTLIHPTITQNLPLFIIRTISDIDIVRKQLDEFDKSSYVEVYHSPFKTSKAVWGRIEFVFDENPRTVIIHHTHAARKRNTPINLELTCGTSCREINLYPKITQAYMSFSKPNNATPFTHEETIIVNPERSYIIEDAPKIIRLLSTYQKYLLDFAITIISAGAKGVSFDFVYSGDHLMFWDFDTDNDEKVLKTLEESGV